MANRRAEIRHSSNEVDIRDLRNLSWKIGVEQALTGNQDDYAIAPGAYHRLSSAAPIDLTGIVAGVDGRELVLINVGSQNITVKNNDAGSAEANRILTGLGTDIVLGAGGMVKMFYDETISRWRSTAKMAAPGPGPGSFVDTINSVQEDGVGNIDLVPAAATDIKISAGTAPNTVQIEPPDWHYFTAPPTNVAATGAVVYGTFIIPASKKVISVRAGVRRGDDVFDAQITISAKNETTTEELTTDAQYPTALTFTTPGAATQRIVVALKNASGTPRDVFGNVALLLENV
jgi:hypothetical protein